MSTYLGQNFLTDSTYTIYIAQKVAQLCQQFDLQQCIEIGPGKGALTKKLIKYVQRPLLLLEKDETLISKLHEVIDIALQQHSEETLSVSSNHNDKVLEKKSNMLWSNPSSKMSQYEIISSSDQSSIIQCNDAKNTYLKTIQSTIKIGDALQVDTASVLEEIGRNTNQTIVVGNLPYYITSPLLTKFFGGGNAVFPVGVFMVQKEVADKIKTNAEKKSYLWRLLNYQYEVTYLKTVPAKAFTPAPKVQSAIFSLVDRSLMAKTNASCVSDSMVHKKGGENPLQKKGKKDVLFRSIACESSSSIVNKPTFSYQKMVTLLDKISMYKRKTLGKSWKMAGLQDIYTLPEHLAGKRLEEITMQDMERILGG